MTGTSGMRAQGWEVLLEGPERELAELAQVKADDWAISHEDSQYILRSPHFAPFGEGQGQEFAAAAQSIVDVVNALMALDGWGAGAVTLGGAQYRRADGSRLLDRFTTESFIVSDRVSVGGTDPNERFARLSDKAFDEAAVARALVSFHTDTWTGIHNAGEEVENQVGGESEIGRFVNLAEYRRMKHTANSYGAVGIDARHAAGFQPPKTPMALPDARALVRELLTAWIETLI